MSKSITANEFGLGEERELALPLPIRIAQSCHLIRLLKNAGQALFLPNPMLAVVLGILEIS